MNFVVLIQFLLYMYNYFKDHSGKFFVEQVRLVGTKLIASNPSEAKTSGYWS
jgi:hypothetical protein